MVHEVLFLPKWKRRLGFALLTLVISLYGQSSSAAPPNIRVASFTDREASLAPSYHLLASWENLEVSLNLANAAEATVARALEARGYLRSPEFMASDLVVVARFGLIQKQPTSEAISDGHAPEKPCSEGTLYVRIEAYDLPHYAEFLDTVGEAAASGAELEFVVWETAAEMTIERSSVNHRFQTLLEVASRHVDTNTRQRSIPLPD